MAAGRGMAATAALRLQLSRRCQDQECCDGYEAPHNDIIGLIAVEGAGISDGIRLTFFFLFGG